MRLPDYEKDGWCLDDGEQYHQEAPETFLIPDLTLRKILRPGDFAKLMFKIAVEGEEEVERMWVIIRDRTSSGYVGVLDNEPGSIPRNDRLWLGTEVPFEYRHIIAVQPGDEKSIAVAKAPAPIPWIPQTRALTGDAACRRWPRRGSMRACLAQHRGLHDHPATKL
jgi:hypothetical protein